MNDKVFFLPDDKKQYSFNEISSLILDGTIQKRSIIWEKSLTNWIKIKDHPDFKEILQEYDRIADEKIKKVMGTDNETVKKREMLKILDDVSTEAQLQPKANNSGTTKLLLLSLVIISIPVIGFFVLGVPKEQKPEKIVEETQIIENINIDDIKFRSGVMKIDEVKGITVKKVAKVEEDKILKEILLEIKKENTAAAAAKNEPEKKQVGLFDKVSDEELNTFRNSFMKKVESKNISATVSTESKLAQNGEELTQKQINETIKNNYSTIKFCYNKALKNNEGISGKMEITIHIMGNGSVAKVINETPKFKGTEMDICVSEQIKKKWLFPKFNGTLSTVTIPFILSAQ